MNRLVKNPSKMVPKTHRVNSWEKRFLVWTRKYPSVEKVPAFVEQDLMERTRNRMRIRIANYMMGATLLGCLAMIYSGKKAAERGESLSKETLEWHRRISEK